MYIFTFWALLGLHILLSQAQFQIEYSEAICQRTWFERMYWEKNLVRKPSSELLRTHVLLGKPAKVTLVKGNYQESFTLDNLNMNGQVICGGAVDRMDYPIGPVSEYQPIIVSTDGYVSYLNSSANRWDNKVEDQKWDVDAISFKTMVSTDIYAENLIRESERMKMQRPTQTTAQNTKQSHHDTWMAQASMNTLTINYMTMAVKSEMRGVMRDRGYMFVMENTHTDKANGQTSGQSLSHISQSYTNTGGITFRVSPYHWFSAWETTGHRDSARWSMGDMQPLKHTNDYVALQWFADACWTIVYKHDQDGVRLDGSLDMLKMYIKMGHRVRVHFDGYTLEANSVLVSPDDVIVAQTSAEMARRGGAGSDKIFFNSKTRQVYRLVHTTGLVRSFLYFVENAQMSAKSAKNFPVTWSVDTRPWNPVLTMDGTNKITMDSATDLMTSVDASSHRVKVEERDPRFKGKTSELYLEINNVRVSDSTAPQPEIIGQSLRTVPFYRGPKDKDFYLYLHHPVGQSIQVSSTSGITIASFLMSSRKYKDVSDLPINSITWYKDGRLLSQ